MDRCLIFCPFSFDHCVFCPSIYGFWLPFGILDLRVLITPRYLRFTGSDYPLVSSDYPFGIFWLPLWYLLITPWYLLITPWYLLITPLVSSDYPFCIFWLPLGIFWLPLVIFKLFLLTQNKQLFFFYFKLRTCYFLWDDDDFCFVLD